MPTMTPDSRTTSPITCSDIVAADSCTALSRLLPHLSDTQLHAQWRRLGEAYDKSVAYADPERAYDAPEKDRLADLDDVAGVDVEYDGEGGYTTYAGYDFTAYADLLSRAWDAELHDRARQAMALDRCVARHPAYRARTATAGQC